jgi:hypothetical protein
VNATNRRRMRDLATVQFLRVQKKSGKNAPMSRAHVGVSGTRLFMARPAAKCAAYISWVCACRRY